MTFSEIVAIERLYDSLNLATHTQHPQKKVVNLYLAINAKDWDLGLRLADELFRDESTDLIRGLAIQLAVAISEEIHDMKLRESWLDRWPQLSSWASEPWLIYTRTYQNALSSFFKGDLAASRRHIETALRVARELKYSRGEIRSLFHFGLVERDLGRQDLSLQYFIEAEILARAEHSSRFLNKVQKTLQSQNLGFEEFERLLLTKRTSAAKKLLLYWERVRRIEKRSRNYQSLSYYWAILFLSLDQSVRRDIALSFIGDPVVRHRYFDFKRRNFGLSSVEENEYNWLCGQLGLNIQVERDEIYLFGTSLRELDDAEVSNFIRLLLDQPEGLDKEAIATKLWNFNYDPVMHENRIHRLVARARKLVGRKDWLKNCYGKYQLVCD